MGHAKSGIEYRRTLALSGPRPNRLEQYAYPADPNRNTDPSGLCNRDIYGQCILLGQDASRAMNPLNAQCISVDGGGACAMFVGNSFDYLFGNVHTPPLPGYRCNGDCGYYGVPFDISALSLTGCHYVLLNPCGSATNTATVSAVPPMPSSPKTQKVTAGCMGQRLLDNFIGPHGSATITTVLNVAGVAVLRPAVASLVPGPGWLYTGAAVAYDVGMVGKSYVECKSGGGQPVVEETPADDQPEEPE